MSTETAEVLRRARALIADPDRWCQGKSAVNAAGGRVVASSPDAVAWSALGAAVADRQACAAIGGEEVLLGAAGALNVASWELYGRGPVRVNDRDGHAAVLEMYDRAIALAESEPES